MKLKVNDQAIETSATTLEQFATEQNMPQSGVAIAVDNRIVTRSKWSSFILSDGCEITILKAFSGG